MLEDTSFNNEWKKLRYFCKPASEIIPIEIIPDNKETYDKCLGVLKAFFTKGVGKRSPFKGFLFEGIPGTGKTELVKQIAKGISASIQNVHLLFIDGATIAAPKWGEAESILKAVFSFRNEFLASENGNKDPKMIVLFDDIESLMLARTSEIAKEWHYSINAVLFHELDNVDASKTFIFATTNKPKLVDDALRDRLYSIAFKPPNIKSLLQIAKLLLRDAGVSDHMQIYILKIVEENLKENKFPTIRDMEREVIMQCIERKVW